MMYAQERVERTRVARWGDTTFEDRFWAKVDRREPDECWPWMGALDKCGYGRQAARLAHRVAYEYVVGPIPDGLVLDHLCHNRACCNPVHLEPVTQSVNASRSNTFYGLARTTCMRGHPWGPLTPGVKRVCRTCRRQSQRDWERRAKTGRAA